MGFTVERRIRFADVDPAGIVFYPRYFEMINGTVEDWFDDGIGYGFDHMIRRDGIGVPLAHIDVDFTAPSELDDRLEFDLVVDEVGRSSIKLTITASSRGETRLVARPVLVWLDIAKHKPASIPSDIKARMLEFRETA